MTHRDVAACRFCKAPLRVVLDLGKTPIANNLCATREEAENAPQFPLVLCCCVARDCGLYQLSIAVDPDTLYGNYTYATPDNPELEAHYERVVDWLFHDVVAGANGVTEIGSNNGAFLNAMLRYGPVQQDEVLGIDPSPVPHTNGHIARVFEPFSTKVVDALLEKSRYGSDIVVVRHCLAHIDDVHEILEGVSELLSTDGVFYIENAYWIDSMLGTQFDQIYHEHMSYLTIEAVQCALRQHEMRLVDVNFSEVHGGSFMLVAAPEESPRQATVNVPVAIRAERAWLAQGLEQRFLQNVEREASATFCEVMEERYRLHTVDAYGASAKAVTRLSAAKLSNEHIRQCIDDSPTKQGKFMPGSGIPIVARSLAWAAKTPDAVLLTAWNYERSFRKRESAYLAEGGRFIK